jgi:ATP synthase protein I
MSQRDKRDDLDALGDRLKQMRDSRADRSGASREPDPRSGLNLAMRVGVELVAALIVGGGIGYLLDMWLGTKPWLLVVFFVLGAAAGMLNVYRVMNGLGQSVGYPDRLRQDETKDDGKR